MPITHIAFLVACLAISGIPPFAGFFSKEEILLAAWEHNRVVYMLALITSGITAFYMFRLYFSIFFGKETHLHDHHDEGSMSMKLPLIVLAVLTVCSGFLPFGNFVTPTGIPAHGGLHLLFSIGPVLVALTGIILAWTLYYRENEKPEKISTSMGGFYRTARSKFYIDEVYLFFTQRVLFNMVGKPAAWIDKHIVDGTMNFTGFLTMLFSEMTRGFQSGKVQQYAIYFIGGIITLTIYLIYYYN